MKTTFTAGIFLALALASAHGADHSLYFGGTGGSVEVSPLKLPDGAAGLTIEFRFKTLGAVRQPVTLVSRWSDQRDDPDKGCFFVGLRPTNQIALGLRNPQGAFKTVTGRGSWTDGAWHHVAAVWNGAEATVYFDGKAVANRSLQDFGGLAPSKRPMVIGPPPDARSLRPVPFDGFIGDVAVWNTARNAETVAGGLAKPLSGSERDLAAFFPLREPSPTAAVKDGTGSGAEGRLTDGLARLGWCVTPLWNEPEPDRPYLHLFGYDLSAPPRADGDPPSPPPSVDNADRQILVSNEKARQAGVLWQEKSSNAIYVTWVDASMEHHQTFPLQGMEDGLLAAGAADPQGHLYYLVIQKSPRNRPESVALKTALHLAHPDGRPLRDIPLDTSAGAFNVYAYGGRWAGSMACGRGFVGLILPRTMHMGGDGLRHQAAIAATFSPDLSRVQRLGHTSSHSFGNVLAAASSGDLIGVDLGDNYPRGVHLHRISRAAMTSRVVFTYKTAHGTSPRGGSPVYGEISGQGRTFYKWSNDNATYTELGGVVEGRASYSVIFSTDRSPEGRVLDNSRIGIRDDPRDLAMLRVVRNFERAPAGTEVSDVLMAGLPKGSAAETGGFYDFGGQWVKQRVTGVVWLTNYGKGEAAHAPHLLPRRDGSILVVWEKTGPDGPSLWAMTVQESGRKVAEPIRLGLDLRLNREDPPVRLGSRVFLLARDKAGRRTRLCFVND